MIIEKAYGIEEVKLGRQGENLARRVIFDVLGQWEEEYGAGGSASMIVQRSEDAQPYPAALTKTEDGLLCWDISSADTAYAGEGSAELRYTIGDVIVKSQRYRTVVRPAMGEAMETPPEPYQSWVDDVLNAAATAEAAVEKLPYVGENGNWWQWDAQKEAFVDTGTSARGEKGDKGDRGAQGEQGVQGPQGEQGEKGDAGETGPKGEKGDTGDTGAQGPKGDKGDTGATGATGPEGPAGPQGAKGDKGDTGERGPQGERGEKGETGKGFKILGYYSTPSALDEAKKATAEPGDAYGVGAGEPYDVYIFDGVTGEFVNNGPLQGAQGEPGATGATGPQGPAGPAGNDGAAGKDGTTYTPSVDAEGNLSWTNDGGKANPESVNIRGPRGLKGDTGDTGATGATGPAGPTGATGAQGPAGKDGAAGAAGATFTPSVDADGNLSWTNDGGRENPATMNIRGPQGAAGPAGADGAAGAPGNAGAAGAAATINGVNALTLTAQEPLSLEQSGGTATLKMTGSPGIEAASYTATLSSSGWATSGSYQAQAVNVSGLKASYPVSPVIDAQLTGTDADGDAAVLEAWSSVNYVTSESGKITAYCIGDAPTANIPLIINTWG